MTFNRDIHHRRSIRLRDYDYASAGAYFVTICTHGKECLFGRIDGEEMVVNEWGEVIRDEWKKTSIIRPNVAIDEFIVMPNHLHAIVFNHGNNVGAYCNTPLPNVQDRFRSPSQTIGAIVRGFKSATTKQVNMLRNMPGIPLWQRNYHERVIRNEEELDIIRQYIRYNPLKWANDTENPVNM